MIDCILDSNSVWARAYYTAHGREGREGPRQGHGGYEDFPVARSATALAFAMVLSILDRRSGKLPHQVNRTLFCWDTASKSAKPRDTPKPAEYHEELIGFTALLTATLGAAHAIPPAHEADDAVATAVGADREASEIYVVTSDKDLSQLAGPHVHVYDLNQKEVLSTAHILHRWKVKRPSQIALALAILGDPGDAVPGLRGWGPKKVQKVFERVTTDMNFSQALEVVDSQIPDHLKEAFYASLDLTLLDPLVPDVPPPAPLRFVPLAALSEFGLDQELESFYERVKRQYEAREEDSLERDA